MNGLREKFQNKKGFTLVEMLIVVAIIAILIAISIPLINGALEKARDSTDQANERSAKAEALLVYMGVSADATDKAIYAKWMGLTTPTPAAGDIWYDAVSGKLVPAGTTAPTANDAYGQCTKTHTDGVKFAGKDSTGAYTGKHTGDVLVVSVNTDGEVDLVWTAVASVKTS